MTDPLVETIAAYDAVAETYNALVPTSDLGAHRRWFLGSRSDQMAPILDVGCGTGRDLAAVLREGVTAVGLDLSGGMLVQASSRAAAPLVRGDVRRLPFARRSLSGAWCSAVLVHLSLRGAVEALLDLHRVLTVDAPLFVSLRTNGNDGWQPFAEVRRWYVHYTTEAARELLTDTGFRVQRIIAEGDAAARTAVHWLAIRATAV